MVGLRLNVGCMHHSSVSRGGNSCGGVGGGVGGVGGGCGGVVVGGDTPAT